MPKLTFFNLTKEKQEQIINAAISEFSKYTFNEVKISSIINKAQIPRSSFYDYFEDKKDLYKHILLLIKEEKMKLMRPVAEKEQESFFETFRELFKAGAKFAATNPEYDKIAAKMYENMEIVQEIFGKEITDVSKSYEYMLTKGIEAGEIREDIDVKFIAKSINILSSQLMIEGVKEGKVSTNELIENICDKMIDFIKCGIKK
ncbi:hypothetical protein GCM10008905_19760 [Clostridium malenominatum]|uniref:HTH tetR-type domain-containing protein n=1 Tax=Clostridium malenominatum TaxID=1539 RepID=A0ABP3U952_9CLOT